MLSKTANENAWFEQQREPSQACMPFMLDSLTDKPSIAENRLPSRQEKQAYTTLVNESQLTSIKLQQLPDYVSGLSFEQQMVHIELDKEQDSAKLIRSHLIDLLKQHPLLLVKLTFNQLDWLDDLLIQSLSEQRKQIELNFLFDCIQQDFTAAISALDKATINKLQKLRNARLSLVVNIDNVIPLVNDSQMQRLIKTFKKIGIRNFDFSSPRFSASEWRAFKQWTKKNHNHKASRILGSFKEQRDNSNKKLYLLDSTYQRITQFRFKSVCRASKVNYSDTMH